MTTAKNRSSPSSRPTTRNVIQRVLLHVYGLARRSGLFETSWGRRIFEWAYEGYKKWVEATDIQILREFVQPSTLVIDVGANVGFFAVRFAGWVTPPGRVLAIEPEVANLVQLRKALKNQRLADRVEVIGAAAMGTAGPAFLAINPDHPGDHRLASYGKLVEGVTLDELVAQRGWMPVSLVKIDVQGAEAAVIAGAEEVLRRFRPALYVELDDANLRGFGSSATDLLDVLGRLGYEPYRSRAGRVPLGRKELLASAATAYVDVLFLSR